MKKIIIDTNFLMIPYQFRVDIFSEFKRICAFNYNLFIYEQSINELNNIVEKQSGKDKRAAQFALKLIKIKGINTINTVKPENKYIDVDSLILNNLDKDTIIATQDLQLKKQLIEKGASVIIIRQKKYLELFEILVIHGKRSSAAWGKGYLTR